VTGGETLPVLTSLAPHEDLEDYRLRVEQDLRRASEAIESHVGVRPVAFAYPFGAYGGIYDSDRHNHPRIGSALRTIARQYSIAFDQDDQLSWGLAACEDDPFHLHRLEVGDWSGRELVDRISKAADEVDGPGCSEYAAGDHRLAGRRVTRACLSDRCISANWSSSRSSTDVRSCHTRTSSQAHRCSHRL
jgi:hypothetical protein